MWFWCGTCYSLWWMFPIMFILWAIVMFLAMRAFFAGRRSCCTPWKGCGIKDDGYGHERRASKEE